MVIFNYHWGHSFLSFLPVNWVTFLESKYIKNVSPCIDNITYGSQWTGYAIKLKCQQLPVIFYSYKCYTNGNVVLSPLSRGNVQGKKGVDFPNDGIYLRIMINDASLSHWKRDAAIHLYSWI